MTRETKIGLLVGLAFIVVFAMLLSHSGTSTSPGDLRQIAHAKKAPAILNEPAGDSSSSAVAVAPEPEPQPVTEGSASAPKVDTPRPSPSEPSDALPNPNILENGTPGVAEPPTGVADATVKTALEGHRAPPISEVLAPQPEVRQNIPAVSPEPTPDNRVVELTKPTPDEPATNLGSSGNTSLAEAGATGSPKEHVVQKGENLNKILRTEYGNAYVMSSSKVKEIFMKANKDHIKDEKMVREGQKLLVPSLPSDMLEPAGGGKVALDVHKSSEANLAGADSTIGGRRAPSKDPKLDKNDKVVDKAGDREKRKDKEGEKLVDAKKPARGTRVYDVQNKDTFSSIARDQLGSETLWKEIKRLNPGVDPSKMKPGVKLKLPDKRPLADAVASGRT